MKTTILGMTLLPLLFAGGAPASGGGTDPTTATNAFAVDLYARLGADGGNLFFSPASVEYALSLIHI